MTEEKKAEPAVPDATAKSDLTLEQRIMSVMQDVFDVKIKALEAKIDGKIDELLKSKEVEMEEALRKGFGLEQDPVVHKSDLIAAIRKAAVENTEKERGVAATEKAGPEGNKTEDPFDKMIKPFTEVQK